MNRKTRLPKGAGSRRKDRLTSEKNSSTGELKKLVQSLPNERVSKYAEIGAAVAAANPELGKLKQAAVDEVKRRNELLGAWKKGKAPPEGSVPKKVSLLKRVEAAAAKGAGALGKGLRAGAKGVQFGIKAVSGEGARELEEVIATAGMKPEEREAYIKKQREAEAKYAAEEEKEMAGFFPTLFPEEAEAAEKEADITEQKREAAERRAELPARREREEPEAGHTTINIYAQGKPKREEMPRGEEEDLGEEELVDEEDITAGNVWNIVNEERAELVKDMEELSPSNIGDDIAEGRRDVDEGRAELDAEMSEVGDGQSEVHKEATRLRKERR